MKDFWAVLRSAGQEVCAKVFNNAGHEIADSDTEYMSGDASTVPEGLRGSGAEQRTEARAACFGEVKQQS